MIIKTNKKIHPYKTVTGFELDTLKLYNYADKHPAFAFFDIDYVNDLHGVYPHKFKQLFVVWFRGVKLNKIVYSKNADWK